MGMKERGKRKGCTGSNEEKETGGELGKELSIGYVSCIVKCITGNHIDLPPKMPWPSFASPFKKADAKLQAPSSESI